MVTMSNGGSPEPIDFIKPIMIYYLNSISSYPLESTERSSLGNWLIEDKVNGEDCSKKEKH